MKLPSLELPVRIGWRDHVIGGAIGIAYFVALVTTARAVGFGRDEALYFRAGTEYFSWWLSVFEHGSSAFQQGAIDSHFSDNHEHPALMKTLFGFSAWLFQKEWPIISDASTAMRLPTMALAAAALWTTYLFGARAWGRAAGVVAAVSLGAMPRVFFHSHLACFDSPIMSFWIFCVYAHWRAQREGGVGWAIATGVLFGLALDTKHNAWMLPAVLVPHAFFVQRQSFWPNLRGGRMPIPTSVVAMAVLGPLVFFALWPFLWNDTLARLQWYVDFHVHHVYYSIEFFGRNVFEPPGPKSYLPVMVIATVPTITLILFGIGAADRAWVGARRMRAWASRLLRRVDTNDRPEADAAETDLLIALSILIAVGPFFLSGTPLFGATKHWLTAYPGLALFAGRGFQLVQAAMRRALPVLSVARSRLAEAGLYASVLLAPVAVTAHSNPYGLSTYVPFVGGTAGGADLGLNRQFWGYTTQNAAEDYLNTKAPPGATVFISDTTFDAWARMQDERRVRRDLRAVGAPHEAQFALVQHELHMNEVDYSIWVALRTDAPAYVVVHDGVPIVSIYRRP